MQDIKEAIRWYRLAAEQGNIGAQILLGEVYLQGEESLQDIEEAMIWFRMAAEQGDATAQLFLAWG